MLLKPSCSWCKDYSLFAENTQLQILLSCYKKLCEYIADTPIANSMVVGGNGGTGNILAVLHEGMAVCTEGNAYGQSKTQSDDRTVHVNIMEMLTKANKNTNFETTTPPVSLKKKSKSSPTATSSSSAAAVNGAASNAKSTSAPAASSSSQSTSNANCHSDVSPTTNGAPPAVTPTPAKSSVDENHQEESLTGVRPSPPAPSLVAATSSPISPQMSISPNTNHVGAGGAGSEIDSEGMMSSASYSVSLSMGEMPRIKIKRKHKSDREGKEHKSVKKKKKDKKHKRHRHHHKHSSSTSGIHSSSSSAHSGINSPDVSSSPSLTPPKVTKLIISGHRAKLLKSGRKLHIKGGCRCGTGTKVPGKFTCLGARCPCYVSEMECTKCKCKGCRNPYTKPRTAIPAHVMRLEEEEVEEKEDSDIDIDIDVTA